MLPLVTVSDKVSTLSHLLHSLFPLAGVAKGLLGAGVGIGVLAGAAAASVFFWRKRRANALEALVSHDLARMHDSVVVTKHKKRVQAIAVSSAAPQGQWTPHSGHVSIFRDDHHHDAGSGWMGSLQQCC